MRLSKFALSLLLASALGACATAPTQEMSDARFALRAAEDAGARDYAGKTLAAAKTTIANAEQQLESGSYIQARNYAILARAEAMRARNIAIALAKAKQAVEESAQAHALPPGAEEALTSARAAAEQGQGELALAEAARATELARQGTNRAHLEKARQLLRDCTDAQRAANAEPIKKAREAILANQGKLAEEYAQRACGGGPQ